MADNLDQIAVLRGHLEEWQELLSFLYGHFEARDLADSYCAMRRTYSQSRMTSTLGRALQRINGYLNDQEDLEDEPRD